MKKIKDIFYDMNDILVALIIVAVATLVIYSNIDSILAYPSQIAEEIQTPEDQTPTNYAENPPIKDPDSSDSTNQGTTVSGIDGQTPEGEDAQGQAGNSEDTPENYSIYINTGSTGEQIAEVMISVGLFKDKHEFYNAVAAAGAEGKLQAGNFIIPSDATPAEVIAIISR